MPRRSNVDINRLVTLYNAEMAINDIAANLGITRASACWHIHKARTLGMIAKEAHLPIKKPVDNSKVKQIVTLYRKGATRKEIAKKLHLAYATVAKYLHETGTVVPTKRIKYTNELISTVSKAYNYGCTQYEMSARFGLTEGQIGEAVRRGKELGLAKDFRGRLSMFHEVADYHKLGYTLDQMKEELEISQHVLELSITTAINQGLIESSAYPEIRANFK